MAKQITTAILIRATPAKVWSVFSSFGNYPAWNPFIKSIKGNVNIGNRITVRIEPPGARGMTFTPRVLTFEAGKELSWLGSVLFSGLFDGAHKFELIDNGDGTTTFIQSEQFTGILVPLFGKQLDDNTKKGFEEMNNRLKQLAEQA